MPNHPTIQCPNPFCKAPNPESHALCDRCETFIPKRYLWAIGEKAAALEVGTLVGDRYFVKAPQVLLETQPAFAPAVPLDISLELEAYLRLFTYRPQVPQVYGVVYLDDGGMLALLEEGALYPAPRSSQTTPETHLSDAVMPKLIDRWEESSALRQLNWLIQIAELWQPLSLVRATQTLLNPNLLRVDGGLLRLLELELIGNHAEVKLADLGYCWSELADCSQIQPFLETLCDRLIQGQIDQSDQLIALLDHEIQRIPYDRAQVSLMTRTDQGPNRQRNEDACYPTLDQAQRWFLESDKNPLLIVCDGIGGHEGGNVASNLAIATIYDRLQHLAVSSWSKAQAELTAAILAGNDAICARNDQEQRTERQRMGTTIVAGLVQGAQLCVAHVGDSRVYRITRTGCHQITIDDDLASREVRQGYTSYRDALQHSGSGSLTQALGMVPAGLLYVHTRRFVLDEDCLFLFCSDGLSDFDRIEECWAEELVPVLDRQVDLETASQRLIQIANLRNGHDNVTVGLLHYVSIDAPAAQGRSLGDAAASMTFDRSDRSAIQRAPDRIRTRLMKPRHDTASLRLIVFWLVLAAVGCAGFMAWLFGVGAPLPSEPIASPTPLPSPSPKTVPAPISVPTTLSAGQFVRLDERQASNASLTLLPQSAAPANPSDPYLTVGEVPAGSLLQVLSRQTDPKQGDWLKLKVCSVPTAAAHSAASPAIQAGAEGWQAESIVLPVVHVVNQPTPDQKGTCGIKKSAAAAEGTRGTR